MKAQDKPKLYIMLAEQFPNALQQVAKRSELGHTKYADLDHDYQGFTRLPVIEYQNALLRHLMNIGEDTETKLDHLGALAWNALALLEMELRYGNKGITQMDDFINDPVPSNSTM